MRNGIERSIVVNASLDRVWGLVTDPGWWIPSAGPAQGQVDAGSVVVREYEGHRYPVEVIRLEPQTYASFRWASSFPDQDLTQGRTTLVEFRLEPSRDSVHVTVFESGFDELETPADARRASYDSNVSGWIEELEHLKTRCETLAEA